MVIQQKTGRPVQFEITADTRASLLAWLERRGGSIDDYAFPSRVDHEGHLRCQTLLPIQNIVDRILGLRGW
jgi:hypothetical protein